MDDIFLIIHFFIDYPNPFMYNMYKKFTHEVYEVQGVNT